MEKTLNLIATLEQEEIARLNRTIPAFAPGDTVIVNVNVVEAAPAQRQVGPHQGKAGLTPAGPGPCQGLTYCTRPPEGGLCH